MSFQEEIEFSRRWLADGVDLFLSVPQNYLQNIAALFANTNAAAVTSIADGLALSSDLATESPRHRWFPLGPSLATAPFRNPFGDPPFAVSTATFDAAGGFREDLAICSHFALLSRLSLAGFPVQLALDTIVRKSEAYPERLHRLSWTEISMEREQAFAPFRDFVPHGVADGLFSVRDWEPDRGPVMPEYCLTVHPDIPGEVIARQADRSEGSAGKRFLSWKSAKQFSMHQGNMGWDYGYRRKEYSTERDEGFVLFNRTRRVTTPEGSSRVEHWTEAHRFPKQLAISPSTQHPAVALRLTGPNSKHVFIAVRRWQSVFVGKIGISGIVSRTADCGDGVVFRLLVDGQKIEEREMLPSKEAVKVHVAANVEVQVGSVLEFQLDPKADDVCDSTNVEFVLQGTPNRDEE